MLGGTGECVLIYLLLTSITYYVVYYVYFIILYCIILYFIDIRDGYKECDGLNCDDIHAFILDLCTN